MKRILIVLSAILSLLLAILYVGSKLRMQVERARGTLQALPEDAIALLRVNSWHGFMEALRTGKGPLSQSLQHREYDWLRRLGGRVDSTLGLSGSWSLSPRHGESLISFYIEGQDDIGWLMALPLGDEDIALSRWINMLFGDAQHVRQYEYDRTLVGECELLWEGFPIRLFASIRHGVALWSNSHILLQRALRREVVMPTLLEEDGFHQVYGSSDRRSVANLFVRPNRVLPLFSQNLRGVFRTGVLSVSRWAPWISLEISDEVSRLGLLGESRFSDSLRCVGDDWRAATPRRLGMLGVLPSTTSFFLRWGFGSGEELLRFFPSDSVGESPPWGNICSGEVILARIRGQDGIDPFWAVFVSCESPSGGVQLLGARTEVPREIHAFRNASALRDRFGDLFPAEVGARYAALEGCIVFAGSESSLRYIISAAQRQQNFQRSLSWQELKDGVQSECNFMLYAGVTGASRWGMGLFSAGFLGGGGFLGRLLGQNGQLVLQVSGARNNLFYSVLVHHGKGASNEDQSIWEVGLKAPISGRPQLVRSHRSDSGLILTQDQQGGLYLIDAGGRTLWYRQLGEQMLGEAVQIDALRNGKIQYAFATRSRIWVVDYEGNTLSGFPYELPSAAVAPLSVFDYAGNRDYRFVVCCENRELVLLDVRGNRKADFVPPRMESIPLGRAELFQYQGRDYIVVGDRNRLYVLNRRGGERTQLREQIRKHPVSPMAYQGKGCVLLLDTQGRLCRMDLMTGSVFRTEMLPHLGTPIAVHLAGELESGAVRCVIVNRTHVRGYSEEGKLLFEYRADGDLFPWVRPFDFGARGRYWGVCSPSCGMIYLLDSKGIARDRFKAETPFSIGRLNPYPHPLRLVAGDRSSVVVYTGQGW